MLQLDLYCKVFIWFIKSCFIALSTQLWITSAKFILLHFYGRCIHCYNTLFTAILIIRIVLRFKKVVAETCVCQGGKRTQNIKNYFYQSHICGFIQCNKCAILFISSPRPFCRNFLSQQNPSASSNVNFQQISWVVDNKQCPRSLPKSIDETHYIKSLDCRLFLPNVNELQIREIFASNPSQTTKSANPAVPQNQPKNRI